MSPEDRKTLADAKYCLKQLYAVRKKLESVIEQAEISGKELAKLDTDKSQELLDRSCYLATEAYIRLAETENSINRATALIKKLEGGE